MTNEREELATAIANRLDTIFGKREFGPAKQDYDLADALLDLGYRKPRTVTTEQELEALPVGSIVRTPAGDALVRYVRGFLFGGDYTNIRPEADLPATVIHEGEA